MAVEDQWNNTLKQSVEDDKQPMKSTTTKETRR